MGKISTIYHVSVLYFSFFTIFLPKKGSYFPNLLKISNVFLAIEAAFSHNFVHIFSTRFDFPKKGPFFPKNRGFCGKCWENDCAAPPPLSTFAPSVRGTRGPRWQANKIIIKGREKARRKKRVMSMYFSFTVWRFLFSLSMSCSKP